MIKTIKGDLLANTRGVIVHGCNAQGVMGSGVAAGVRARFPEAYKVYRKAYLATGQFPPIDGGIPAGELIVIGSSDSKCHLELGTITFVKVLPELWIVNGITQDFYGRNSTCFTDYAAIKAVFEKTVELLETLDPDGAADLPLLFPKIGAGRGGGDWDIITKIIEEVVPVHRRMELFVVDEEPVDCR
jgi:O-acetyl-ADP-ribose deacetylase (regulator of RNase III)